MIVECIKTGLALLYFLVFHLPSSQFFCLFCIWHVRGRIGARKEDVRVRMVEVETFVQECHYISGNESHSNSMDLITLLRIIIVV